MLLAARSVQVDGGRGEALFERSPPVREHGRPVGGEDVLDVLLGQRAKGGREDVAVPGGAGARALVPEPQATLRADHGVAEDEGAQGGLRFWNCLLYTSPSPRD